MSKNLWQTTRRHLLGCDGERFAFLLCGIAEVGGGLNFLAKDAILISDLEVERATDGGLQVSLDALLRVTNRARAEQLAVVEAHRHSGTCRPTFSLLDIDGLKEFVPYILKDIPGMPYAATVWSGQYINGLCWKDSFEEERPLSEIRIVGDNIIKLSTASTAAGIGKQKEKEAEDRTARQILMIGRDGQRRIEETHVAIVGLGGIGSQVSTQLAYLGVRNFMLVDFDRIEATNLNRLVGAGPEQIGRTKVEVAKRTIQSIAGKECTHVTTFKTDLRTIAALEALKRVYVIFGCVDNDGARLILNELALAYLIPYIDCATGINIQEGSTVEAGGRVVVVHPDGPCLLCCNEIDKAEASDYLASPEELEDRKRRGYVSGADIPSPSVVSLNGIISSVAVTEFMALVTGFRPAQVYTSYDMLKQSMVTRMVKTDPECVGCSIKGIGDRSNISRYAKKVAKKDSYWARLVRILERRFSGGES